MSPLRGEAARPTYSILRQVVRQPDREVHIAHHAVFGAPCIQKTVMLNGVADSVLVNEPLLVEKLDHPHIVRIREAQFDPAHPLRVTFVMPYYEGGSVDARLQRSGTFSVCHALRLCYQVLDALAYVHTTFGWAHRDIKGGNVLLDAAEENAYLSDFGSAARLDAAGNVPALGFTLPYLDPAARSGTMNARSDVYSTGLMLFEMLSGFLPLPGAYDPAKAQKRVLMEGKRAFTDAQLTHAPHVPAHVRRLVNKAMSCESSRRFAGAADFATAVDREERRAIDWGRVAGTGLGGEWQGGWPPRRASHDRRTYRVESTVLTRGKNAGKLRVVASFQAPGATSFRGFGGLDKVIEPTSKALGRFFDDVDDAVAQNRAAS